ncbi:hypothetical protein GE09DRAFT_594713 [Coniochaeta sp. 2T2.1]|nr:hypothetical protein GE09DRAFT_594713 [Coniochaeta sp. 2T2.1]
MCRVCFRDVFLSILFAICTTAFRMDDIDRDLEVDNNLCHTVTPNGEEAMSGWDLHGIVCYSKKNGVGIRSAGGKGRLKLQPAGGKIKEHHHIVTGGSQARSFRPRHVSFNPMQRYVSGLVWISAVGDEQTTAVCVHLPPTSSTTTPLPSLGLSSFWNGSPLFACSLVRQQYPTVASRLLSTRFALTWTAVSNLSNWTRGAGSVLLGLACIAKNGGATVYIQSVGHYVGERAEWCRWYTWTCCFDVLRFIFFSSFSRSGLSFINLTLSLILFPPLNTLSRTEIVFFHFSLFYNSVFLCHSLFLLFSSDSKKVVGWSAGSRRQARGDGVGRNNWKGGICCCFF